VLKKVFSAFGGKTQAEAEQVFFNDRLIILEDIGHSSRESGLHALGRTDAGRQFQ
jgi:uncharacterized protein